MRLVLTVGLLAAGLLLPCIAPARAAGDKFLLINIDDLNDWIEPLGGHPDTLTPNLNRLAARGMTFTNAHATGGVCNTSRVSFLTGIMPSTSLIRTNAQGNFRSASAALTNARSLPQAFKEAGYEIRGAGKLFHLGPDHVDDGGGTDWDVWWDGNTTAPHHSYPPSDETGGLPKPLNGLAGKTLQYADGTTSSFYYDWGAIPNSTLPQTKQHQVTAWAQGAIASTGAGPTFVSVGLERPHEPLYYTEEVLSRFNLSDIDLPPYLADDRNDVPSYWDDYTSEFRQITEEATVLETGATKGNVWRELTLAYLASIAQTDDMIGMMLDAVEARSDADQWTIALVSDHGVHHGEKNHFGKSTVWEETTHVPMMISGPGIAVGETSAAVSLLDLYPTLVGLAGLAPDVALQGRDLGRLLEDPTTPDDHFAVTIHGSAILAMRTGHYRYIFYPGGKEELYDHDSDPNEWTNLSTDPGYASTLKRLRRQFQEWSIESGNRTLSLQRLSVVAPEGQRVLDWFSDRTGLLSDDANWSTTGAGDFTFQDNSLVSSVNTAMATAQGAALNVHEDFQIASRVRLDQSGSRAGVVFDFQDPADFLAITLSGDGNLHLANGAFVPLPEFGLGEWFKLVVAYRFSGNDPALEVSVLDANGMAVYRSGFELDAPLLPGGLFGVLGEGGARLDDFSLLAFPTAQTITGDYNGDGVVDAADYAVFRSHLGSDADLIFAPGSREGGVTGPIGNADYAAWRAHFGESAGVTQSIPHAAPTPAAIPLLCLLPAAIAVARTRANYSRR